MRGLARKVKRKVINLRLWIEDSDPQKMTDEFIRNDIKKMLTGRAYYHTYDLVGLEQLDVLNERCNVRSL